MPTSLRSTLSELADQFAQSVLEAVRSVSLSELSTGSGAAAARASARADGRSSAAPSRARKPARSSPATGRLPRRSADDIAKLLDQVLAVVRKHKGGLRAEQIRTELGVRAKELPRVLKEGLSQKKLKSKGWKRATTYHAS